MIQPSLATIATARGDPLILTNSRNERTGAGVPASGDDVLDLCGMGVSLAG